MENKPRKNSRDYWLNQASVKIEQENYAGALKCLNKILENDPYDIEVLECISDLFILLNDKKKANKYIKKLFSRIPDFYKVLTQLGKIFRKKGKFGLSTLCFLSSLKIEPKYSVTWFNLGMVYMFQSNFEHAIICFWVRHAFNPYNAVVWKNLGQCYQGSGQEDYAQYCFKRSLEINPHNECGDDPLNGWS